MSLFGGQSTAATTDEWLTPPFVLAALGDFDLDPCAPITRPWPTAAHHYTVANNGLLKPWFGRVWLNPPYGRVLGRWLGRMAGHGRGIALIFARTDTDAFRNHVWQVATALLFLHGRLDFLDIHGQPRRRPDGWSQNSGAPSVLCAYGHEDAHQLVRSGLDGQFVPLRLPRAVAMGILDGTWRYIIVQSVGRKSGPVSLADLYAELAHHPKTARNPNWRAKVRQILQQGPFRRVGRGQWEAAP